MKKVFFILLTFGFIYGCVKPIYDTPTTGDIVGSVSDKTTGEPVATANISITPGGKTTVTGSDGTFEYKNLEAGEYIVTINKEGYKTSANTITVTAGESAPVYLLLEMIPAIITPDRDVLDFGDQEGVNTLSFSIVNSGYEALEWSIEENCDWIMEVKPASGILGHGKTGTVVVVINRGNLLAGKNETVLIVSSTNGRAELNVSAVGKERLLPALNVLDATEVTTSTAVLNAEIIEVGSPKYTERGFVYSTYVNPTIEDAIAKLTAPITESNTYSVNVSKLELGTRYYVRAYARNSVGVAYSTNEISFEPIQKLPIVVTDEPSNKVISTGRITFNGNVTYLGDPAYYEHGFVYGFAHNPSVEYDNKKVVSGKSSGVFSSNISGLEMNTTYYVRAFATNEQGTAYGEEKEIDMSQIMPVIKTKNPEYITSTSATLYASLDFPGDPILSERGFIYGTMPVPTMDLNDITKLIVAGSAVGDYTSYATELTAGTIYYVRAYAISAGAVSYGDVISFETQSPDYVVLQAAGIMVQKEDIGKSNWRSVNLMCENSILSGYTDWRLPSKEELLFLYDNRDKIGGFTTSDRYWSSTYWGSSDGTQYYYYISFNAGITDGGYSDWDISGRCVRTITSE